MTLLFTFTLFFVPAADVPPELAQKYLQRCEAAKTAAIAAKEAELKSLTGEKLAQASAQLAKFKADSAAHLHLPLPPVAAQRQNPPRRVAWGTGQREKVLHRFRRRGRQE